MRTDKYDEGAGDVAAANAGRAEYALPVADGGFELPVANALGGDSAPLQFLPDADEFAVASSAEKTTD